MTGRDAAWLLGGLVLAVVLAQVAGSFGWIQVNPGDELRRVLGRVRT